MTLSSARPVCRSGNPEIDATAWKFESSRIDDSHLRVSVLRCPTCDQRALTLWTELIDWDGGDDTQATMIVPVPASEDANALALVDDESEVSALLKRLPTGYLIRSCPRDFQGQPVWVWQPGNAFILPHD